MTISAQWPLRDTRTATQLEHDKRDVRQQVSVLDAEAVRDLEAIVERIRARQRTADRSRGLPFVRFTPDGALEFLGRLDRQDLSVRRLVRAGAGDLGCPRRSAGAYRSRRADPRRWGIGGHDRTLYRS